MIEQTIEFEQIHHFNRTKIEKYQYCNNVRRMFAYF